MSSGSVGTGAPAGRRLVFETPTMLMLTIRTVYVIYQKFSWVYFWVDCQV